MNPLFLDTGYVLALELKNDQHHQAAIKHWRKIQENLPMLVTTSYVFDEIITHFNSRGYHAKAVEVGTRLLNSPSIEFVSIAEQLFQDGWAYLQKYQDKKIIKIS